MKKANIAVIIPYHKNIIGLTTSLILLQNQTILPEHIVVIDTSKDKSGVNISQFLYYGNVPITVEYAQVNITKAWNKGIDIAKRFNHNTNYWIINDDLIFPINSIEIFQFAISSQKSICYVPETPDRYHKARVITVDFNSKQDGPFEIIETNWMPGFCFLLTKTAINNVGLFDEDLEIWYSDTDYQERVKKYSKDKFPISIGLIKNFYVYHYGGLSYRYTKEEVIEKIAEDRLKFNKKYENTLAGV